MANTSIAVCSYIHMEVRHFSDFHPTTTTTVHKSSSIVCTCMSPTSSVYATCIYMYMYISMFIFLSFREAAVCHGHLGFVESTVHLEVLVLLPTHLVSVLLTASFSTTTKILSLLTISSTQMYICQWMQLTAYVLCLVNSPHTLMHTEYILGRNLKSIPIHVQCSCSLDSCPQFSEFDV